MRPWCIAVLVLSGINLAAQDNPELAPRLLVVKEAIALPQSMAQIGKAATKAWPYSFGQEPGSRIVLDDPSTGRLEGVARFNFKSSTTANRPGTLGIIEYRVGIQAENGLCRILISQFVHTGNRNAPGGAIDLGHVYAAERPPERVPGISRGAAQRLNEDMRNQLRAHLGEVIKTFRMQLRVALETE